MHRRKVTLTATPRPPSASISSNSSLEHRLPQAPAAGRQGQGADDVADRHHHEVVQHPHPLDGEGRPQGHEAQGDQGVVGQGDGEGQDQLTRTAAVGEHRLVQALQLVPQGQARQQAVEAHQSPQGTADVAQSAQQAGPHAQGHRQAQLAEGVARDQDHPQGQDRQGEDPDQAVHRHRDHGFAPPARILVGHDHALDQVAAGEPGHHQVEEHAQEGQSPHVEPPGAATHQGEQPPPTGHGATHGHQEQAQGLGQAPRIHLAEGPRHARTPVVGAAQVLPGTAALDPHLTAGRQGFAHLDGPGGIELGPGLRTEDRDVRGPLPHQLARQRVRGHHRVEPLAEHQLIRPGQGAGHQGQHHHAEQDPQGAAHPAGKSASPRGSGRRRGGRFGGGSQGASRGKRYRPRRPRPLRAAPLPTKGASPPSAGRPSPTRKPVPGPGRRRSKPGRRG